MTNISTQNAQRQESRKHEITVCSVLLCLCVLFIHGASDLIKVNDVSRPVYYAVSAIWRMCGVGAQGFIFLAALRYTLSAKRDGKKRGILSYYLSRFLRIVPLYLVWSAIYYAYSVLAEGAEFNFSEFLRLTLIGDTASHLYYVTVLLQLTLIAPLSLLLRKKLPASVILPASVLLTSIFGDHLTDLIYVAFPSVSAFNYSDRVFTSFLIFWSAGCCAGAAYDRFCEFLDNSKAFIFTAFALTAAFDLGAMYMNHVREGSWQQIWCVKQIQTLYVLSAILMLMTVGRMVVKNRTDAPVFFQKSELAGYFIYLSHLLPAKAVFLLCDKLGISTLPTFFIAIAVLAVWFVLSSLAYGNRLYMLHAKRKLNR